MVETTTKNIQKKIAIIYADFNEEITSVMFDTAVKHAKRNGLIVEKVIKVPGCYDIPYAVKKVLENNNNNNNNKNNNEQKRIEGIVALGAVIQGDTYHDIIVAEECARKCSDLSVEYIIPIALGVIGPRASWDQAFARKEEFAVRAVDAVKLLMDI